LLDHAAGVVNIEGKRLVRHDGLLLFEALPPARRTHWVVRLRSCARWRDICLFRLFRTALISGRRGDPDANW
jgi:hypothetical protein